VDDLAPHRAFDVRAADIVRRTRDDVPVEDGRVVCRSCDEAICGAEENYKVHALCETKPLTEVGPLLNDPPEYVDDEREFRQFYCPGCATLLENEVIKAESDPVHDMQIFDAQPGRLSSFARSP